MLLKTKHYMYLYLIENTSIAAKIDIKYFKQVFDNLKIFINSVQLNH